MVRKINVNVMTFDPKGPFVRGKIDLASTILKRWRYLVPFYAGRQHLFTFKNKKMKFERNEVTPIFTGGGKKVIQKFKRKNNIDPIFL